MSLSRDYTNFGPPFSDSDADIVLRSSFTSVLALGSAEDRIVATDFLVHKLLLIKASSVFKSLLSSCSETLDQQNAEALKHGIRRDIRGNLPVLCLPEDRDTVHYILTAIYPVDIVYPQSFETMVKTSVAARKYGMPSVLALFRTYCNRVAPVVTAENAFCAYVLASNEGLKEEALEAAQLTLSLPQTFETYGSSLCNASGPALLALWKYRRMAVQAIKHGVDLCLEEVGDFRDWRVNLLGDRDCCLRPTLLLRQQFATFTKRISQNFSVMNISSFIDTMSPQGGFTCLVCKRQQRLDKLRLFDCLERHVRGQIEQMHGELLSLFDGLGETIDLLPAGGRPRNFGAPFDRGDSDITIRSCDRVDFQIHKAVLCIASAAFEDMFTAPGPSPHRQGQVKQVINLTEDSKTLHHLFFAIYPMDSIIPDTLEDALSLLSACQKYQMDSTATRVRALLRARTPPLFTSENCFRTYGIARRYHLEEEALLSARLTLERRMTFEDCGEDLRFISGADLFRLCGYRNECTKVAKDCINDMTDYKPPPIPFLRCSGSAHSDYDTEELLSVLRWWHGHFLRRITFQPSPKVVTDRPAFERAIASHRAMSRCSLCLNETRIGNTICAVFGAKLSKVIDQVSLGHALGRTPKLICIAGSSRCLNLVCYTLRPSLCFDAFGAVERGCGM
ncbi:hypothetical protein H4582DRAFT_1384690 [Lactarius indigo]|nr:hypothetical protein H4582DRAFT_1384690 [Lactarius indigo]